MALPLKNILPSPKWGRGAEVLKMKKAPFI
jgi:hypothetical protein